MFRYLLILLGDIRPSRLLHYYMMVALGAILCLRAHAPVTANNLSGITRPFMFALLSLGCAWMSAVIYNNIADVEIDRISNPGRPLIRYQLDISAYRNAGRLMAVMAFALSLLVSVKASLVISFIMATYYLYSMPPLRLKRVTGFSKLVISINSLACIALGYFIIQNDMSNVSMVVIFIMLLGYTLSANFIDIKDEKGDRAQNIKTLPVVMGLKNAKILIGAGFFLTSISYYFLLRDNRVLPFLILAGVIQYLLINKKNYREWQLMSFMLASMFGLMVYLLYSI